MVRLIEARCSYLYKVSVVLCSEPTASTAKRHIFIFIDYKKRKSDDIEPGNKTFWSKQNFQIVNEQF